MADCGTLTVLPGVDESAVTLDGCDISPTTLDLAEGTTITASVTLTNNNNSAVLIDGELIVQGSVVNQLSEAVLQAGQTRTFELTFGGHGFDPGADELPVDLNVAFTVTRVANATSASASAFRSTGCGACSSPSRRRRRVSNPLRRR